MTQVIALGGTAATPPIRPANPLLNAPILPTLVRLTLPNLAAMLVMAAVAIAETIYVCAARRRLRTVDLHPGRLMRRRAEGAGQLTRGINTA